ncbi:uncharacterized protein N7487_007785 [Penicillium crustosum]|uniref:uncharacterized protein n=1 Tax=Penicillium crustosum TaxID=36656 RepID=UPI0023A2F47C|nr:uncharacterized protein N7487_007785 [Penicillium crustosum]KAJ5401889.1 hypothetical protein N7487_007785 [Penicillium crustosum]
MSASSLCTSTERPVYILLAILVALPLVRADGWDDFSNNLATDLAPFLSLFGEQITKQYLSESITVIDYFIFAMAPMGILTAVVSAIRVCGTPSLRAFIGRAQEGAGNAEAELCSSTSRDVCELYNSGGIARVFGRPKILEVVHDPDHDFSDPNDATAGIYTFQDYILGKGKDLWKEEKPKIKPKIKTNDAESARGLDPLREPDTAYTPFAPNLSLNIGIKKQSTAVSLAIAVVGFLLQVGVLIFAGIATYYLKWDKDGSPPESYACPLVITGTVLVCGGMFNCAFLVGQSTKEDVWHREENHTANPSMYWIQPGGQIIGDQTFDAFSFTDHENKLKKYTTSRRDGSKESKFEVWAAIGTTISGFVLQFIGLRGIHSAVSIAQLGVIMVMSMARAGLRMQRLEPDDNCFAKFPDQVLGHELDWLALRIGRNDIEKDVKNHTDHPSPRSASPPIQSLTSSYVSSFSGRNLQCRYFWRLRGAPETNKISRENPSAHEPKKAAAKLLAYRTRLASLTISSPTPASNFKIEMVEVRNESQQLAALIEATAKKIFSKAEIKKEWKDATSMFWGIDCTLYKQNEDLTTSWKNHTVYLEFTQDPDDPRNPWMLKSKLELEAILGLWVWSLKSDPAVETEDTVTGLKRSTTDDIQARRIVPTDQVREPDLGIWLGDDINIITEYNLYNTPADIGDADIGDASTVWTKTGEKDVEYNKRISSAGQRRSLSRVRFFGWKAAQLSRSLGYETPGLWSAPIKGSLVSMCAQEVFASFITSMLDIVDGVGLVDVQETEPFRLENSLVADIVGLFTEMGLGSRQEALFYAPHSKYLGGSTKSAAQRRRRKEWKKAEKMLRWAWSTCTQSQSTCTNPASEDGIAEQATIALGELYRWALVDETGNAFGKDGISWLGQQKPSQSVSTCKVIDRYVDVASRFAQYEVNDAGLLTAMEKGCLTSALLLLTHPASKMGNKQKRKTLFLAAKYGWAEVVLVLFELRSEPDVQDAAGRTPLSYAAEKGNFGVVRELVDWGSFPNSADNQHRTPLSYASGAGSYMVTELLLRDNRVSADSRDIKGRTPLSWAAENGYDTVAKQLLETDVDIDAEGDSGRTALSWAAENGHSAVVKQLLEAGVDGEPKDDSGRTALSWAATNGHSAVVKQLLEAGVNGEPKDDSGRTALSWAAKNGHSAVVKQLLEADVDINPKDKDGRTPLSLAVGNGHSAVVKQLLGADADIDVKYRDRQTPLSLAAKNGHDAVVKQLLETGKVDINVECYDRRTPLSLAAENGHSAVVKQLLEANVDINPKDKDGRTPLSWAAENGHDTIVKQLLETGKVDVDAKGNDSRTPLLLAAKNGYDTIVKQLLETGKVDVDTKGQGNRQTPLSLAAENGHDAIFKQLLETGKVDVDAKGQEDRQTPLSLAAKNGHDAVVEQLLETGKVDVDAKDSDKQTPLSLAAKNGHDAVVKQLLETGKVDVDAKGNDRRTPLALAAENGHDAVVKQLLETGKVNVDAKGYDRRTPLSLAAKNGHDAVVKQLLEDDVNINSKDKDGRTPLSLAVGNGHDAVAKRLLETGRVDPHAEDNNGQTLLWRHINAELLSNC